MVDRSKVNIITKIFETAMTDNTDNTDNDLDTQLKVEIKPTMLQILVEYLTKTSPGLLILHLFYIMMVCASLSFSYVMAFHWATVVQIYTDAHDVKGFSKNLKMSVENDTKIAELLHETLDKTGGIRAYVYRYHNGLAAISSVPFFFQTNTHEIIAPGGTRLLPYEQRIPASFNILINNQFIKNQCAIVTNTDEDKGSNYYYFWTSRGAKSFIRCPIYLDNGDLFGFVGVDYATNGTQLKKDAQDLEEVATQIGNIFETGRK